MKKLLLFAAALIIAAGAMAQTDNCDVYSIGLNPETSGSLYGGIWKNQGSFSWFTPSGSNHFVMTSITKNGTNGLVVTADYKSGNTYGTGYTYTVDNSGNKTTVMTATGSSNNYYHTVKGLSYGGNVYTIGERQPSDNDEYQYNEGYMCVWKNNSVMHYDPYYGYPEEAKGACISRSNPGYQNDQLNIVYTSANSEWGASGNWTGYVKEIDLTTGNEVREFALEQINHEPTDILAIDSSISFIIPVKVHNDSYNGTSTKAGFWWMNGYTGLMYYRELPVTSTSNSAALFAKQDAGMAYIAGTDGYNIKVWRFYASSASYISTSQIETVYSVSAAGVTLTGLDVNSNGVYLSGYLGNGKIWKDGVQLYDLSAANLNSNYASETYGLAAVEKFNGYTVRQLPYEENFEMGNTDWVNCKYTNSDGDNVKWTRYNNQYDNNKSCLQHSFGGNQVTQNGNFYTSMVQLPSGSDQVITLTLKTWIDWASNLGVNGAYARIYVAEVSNTTDFSNFSYTKIKDFTAGEFDEESDEAWVEYTFDLSSYRGKVISINFDYGGKQAHLWQITDIKITAHSDGVNESESTTLSVMPNPANDVIRVNGLNGTEEVNVYNTLGQVVKTARLSDGESLNISDLSAGIYMLRSENSTQVVKFTVK